MNPGLRATADPEVFRQACARFATGVAIATVLARNGSPHGLTISSFTSVSMAPPLVLVCIDLDCPFLTHFRLSTHFAVNVLTESQRDLSVIFSAKPEGRFDGVEWTRGESGAPLLRGCLATLECRAASILELGDHALFVGEAERVESHAGKPLVYFNRDYRSLG
jgi:flavin reductase (DIM6/NTAB) family NADH-FMN oxidoreductase RutF